MDQGDAGKKAGQMGVVLVLAEYRGRRRKKPKQKTEAFDEWFMTALDGATRDLHAAASMTLKMVWLARNQGGLPQL
jgi:hypothetical protein